MCPIVSGRPSRPASFSRVFLQPVSATRLTRRQASAPVLREGRVMRRGILSPGDPRAHSEPRRAQWLVCGDAGVGERTIALPLEDHPQTLEGELRLTARPARAAELLLERLARGPRLPCERALDAGQARSLAGELPDPLPPALAPATAPARLPD